MKALGVWIFQAYLPPIQSLPHAAQVLAGPALMCFAMTLKNCTKAEHCRRVRQKVSNSQRKQRRKGKGRKGKLEVHSFGFYVWSPFILPSGLGPPDAEETIDKLSQECMFLSKSICFRVMVSVLTTSNVSDVEIKGCHICCRILYESICDFKGALPAHLEVHLQGHLDSPWFGHGIWCQLHEHFSMSLLWTN